MKYLNYMRYMKCMNYMNYMKCMNYMRYTKHLFVLLCNLAIQCIQRQGSDHLEWLEVIRAILLIYLLLMFYLQDEDDQY